MPIVSPIGSRDVSFGRVYGREKMETGGRVCASLCTRYTHHFFQPRSIFEREGAGQGRRGEEDQALGSTPLARPSSPVLLRCQERPGYRWVVVPRSCHCKRRRSKAPFRLRDEELDHSSLSGS